MKEFFYRKMNDIYFDQLHQELSTAVEKKSICLNSKADFFAVGQVSNVIT